VGKSESNVNRTKALELAIIQIEKSYGKGAILKFGEQGAVANVNIIPTGIISIDKSLGVWGFPRGRVVEIYGPEASGKTTLALHVAAQAQKAGGIAAFVDAEHAMDPLYTRKLGVNLDELLISQPDNGEQALDIVETLVRSNAVDVIIIDSVAALVPRAEIEGDMGDTHIGIQARLMSQALRKLTAAISKSQTCVIFINQMREKVGVMFGSNETTPGGRALKFYASVRIDIRRIGSIKEAGINIGNRVRVKIVKNKVAIPFLESEVDIIFGQGISREGDILDLGTKYKLIEKSGSWISFKGERIGQGRENARLFLKDHLEVTEELAKKIKEVSLEESPFAFTSEPARDAATISE